MVGLNQSYTKAIDPTKPDRQVDSNSTSRSMETLRPINIKRAKQLFFLRKEKRAVRAGFKPTTHCLLGRCSNH